MDYILKGDEKAVSNVIKEQRIRMMRGMISIIPISDCGLVTEEDARKTLETHLKEKDELISSLTQERDAMKVRITELEHSAVEKIQPARQSGDETSNDVTETDMVDNKELMEVDSKELSADDSKNTGAADNKSVSMSEDKKSLKAKNSK